MGSVVLPSRSLSPRTQDRHWQVSIGDVRVRIAHDCAEPIRVCAAASAPARCARLRISDGNATVRKRPDRGRNDVTQSDTLWNRIGRGVKNHPLGVAVLGILAVAGAIAGFKNNLEAISCWNGSNLVVSDLEPGTTVFPLEGQQVVKTQDNRIAFSNGFRIQLPLRHDQCGTASIVVRHLKVDIRSIPEPAQDQPVDLSKLPPQGFSVGTLFLGVIKDNKIEMVSWTLPNNNRAIGRNVHDLLQTDPPISLVVKKGDDVETVNGALRSLQSGMANVSLSLVYDIDGSTIVRKLGSVLVLGKAGP